MDKEQQRAAKEHMVALLQAGCSWQEAATRAGVQTSRSAAYRLLQKGRTQGAIALQDGRHGHPAKLREPVLQWLKDYCQANPQTPSHMLQQALWQHFGLRVSISHLNATRAALGRSSRDKSMREKNSTSAPAMSRSGKKE
jgi:transposase